MEKRKVRPPSFVMTVPPGTVEMLRKPGLELKERSYELFNADPDCNHNVVHAPGKGLLCTKCNGFNSTDPQQDPNGNPLSELFDADPNCIHNIVCAPGGGVKCTKCSGWFCY